VRNNPARRAQLEYEGGQALDRNGWGAQRAVYVELFRQLTR
jgi:hypothetical protein